MHDGNVVGNTVKLTEQLLRQANSEQILTSTNTAAGLDNSYRNRLRLIHRSDSSPSEVSSCEFVWHVGDITRRLGAVGRTTSGHKRHLRLKYGESELATTQGDLRVIKLGREASCHLSILDDLASRDHCTIERRGEAFVLLDHSTNGTFITEEGAQEVRLEHGEAVLAKHGWLALGQPRACTDQVVEYFCT
jgi:hypothetical protein